MNKRNVYTTGQLARIFHVGTAVIRKWIDRGHLKGTSEYRGEPGKAGKRHRLVQHADLEAFAREYGVPLEWDDEDEIDLSPTAEEAKAAAPVFGVGETVIWNSKIGPVEAEYRGKTRGVDGWEACIIVRNPGESPYQHMVPLGELEKRPEPEEAKPKALRDYFDRDAIDGFLIEAVGHYDKLAPTVADHVNDLYVRFNGYGHDVTLLELVEVLRLREEGEWEHPNHAANRIYKLRDRLGMDTTGQVGF